MMVGMSASMIGRLGQALSGYVRRIAGRPSEAEQALRHQGAIRLSNRLLRETKQKAHYEQTSSGVGGAFFSGNAATYDQIASFSTLWLDGWWKRKILSKIPKTSNRIIEQASGTGILTCKIAQVSFPSAALLAWNSMRNM
jgi:hypothetical protein